jgi:hypothetical protein
MSPSPSFHHLAILVDAHRLANDSVHLLDARGFHGPLQLGAHPVRRIKAKARETPLRHAHRVERVRAEDANIKNPHLRKRILMD